jgi:hypothetical protein
MKYFRQAWFELVSGRLCPDAVYTFLVAGQIHGNYFMSAGTWLTLGIAASMRANEKRGCKNRG